MMQYQLYQLWTAEHPRTAAAQRAADARSGALAAATTRTLSAAGRQLRAAASLRPLSRRASQPVCAPAPARARAAACQD